MPTDVLPDANPGAGVFARTDGLQPFGHEQVIFCRDTPTGLRAIISIHNTLLGPGLGGTRFFPYRTESEALDDGLRLSQGMTFKAAAAGISLGGAKAVIIGNPDTLKTPALLRAYGRFVDSLGGRYYTAADVGTNASDLDLIGESTRFVVGRTPGAGGSGDTGHSTAFGVFCAMRSAAQFLWGVDGLRGRKVGVEGAGKVGIHLIGLLASAGASIAVSDPRPSALQRVANFHAGIDFLPRVVDADVDIYAPCALGATLTPESVIALQARLVCGAANNQLSSDSVGEVLMQRNIVWVPDFVANAGGLIQAAGELQSRDAEQVSNDIAHIGATVSNILQQSRTTGVSAAHAARAVATTRLQAAQRTTN